MKISTRHRSRIEWRATTTFLLSIGRKRRNFPGIPFISFLISFVYLFLFLSPRPYLARAVFKSFWRTLLFSGICKLCADLLNLATPYFLSHIIAFVQYSNEPVHVGVMYACGKTPSPLSLSQYHFHSLCFVYFFLFRNACHTIVTCILRCPSLLQLHARRLPGIPFSLLLSPPPPLLNILNYLIPKKKERRRVIRRRSN